MFFYIASILSLFIDYVSKYLFQSILINKKIEILGDFLTLQLSKNNGIAFSFPVEGVLLKIITIIIIILITIYYLKFEQEKNKINIQIGYGLIIGGATGNAIERIFIGHVTDFISVKYFAIFNFADIFINIGVIILLLSFLLWKPTKKLLKLKKKK